MQIEANRVDVAGRKIEAALLTIAGGRIERIEPTGDGSVDAKLPYALPGFIDAHVHIESSMLVPSQFARLAVRHGTVATVSDPHEIANVMGIAGIDFMITDANKVPLKFFFGAPSCVPATTFETSGATIRAGEIAELLQRDDIHYLAEMMNYPGVLAGDDEITKKLQAAATAGKPIDGHAPGLMGEDAIRYINAGISTDHECTSLAEARHKLSHGMKILIREGSAAKNFEALFPLIDTHPESVMLCSDDKHPDDLAVSHINALVRRAVEHGCELFNVLQAACLNPIEHYGLGVGQLRIGDPADFILVDNLNTWDVQATYIGGDLVAQSGRDFIDRVETPVINHFQCREKEASDFASLPGHRPVRAIRAIDGSLLTESVTVDPEAESDIATLVVVNRYRDAPVAQAPITGFGIERGAIASCVAHDSHNIVAVGKDPAELCRAVNAVIEHRGGIAAACGDECHVLPLPIGGIMTSADGETVAADYGRIDRFARERLGSVLSAPFMTLSFMALLVIPSLKLSDRGLFDADRFEFVES